MLKTKNQNKRSRYKTRNTQHMIDNKTIEFIKKEAAKEFPEDEALQQVHISRKIISLEAKAKGMNLVEYIKSSKQKNWVTD